MNNRQNDLESTSGTRDEAPIAIGESDEGEQAFGSHTAQVKANTRHLKALPVEWQEIDDEIAHRHELITNAVTRLSTYVTGDVNLLNLAATDVFVEKAQHRLTTRAKKFMWWGGVAGATAVSILLAAAGFVISTPSSKLLDGHSDAYHLIAAIVRAISIGGFVGGAVYFLGGMSSALIHEAVVLLNRRHALRFGRLSVYLQGGKVDPAMLHEVFHWNDEFSSAFKTIKAEEMKRGGLSGFVEPPSKTLEGAAKLAESIRPEIQKGR